jgi:hypothetical protein
MSVSHTRATAMTSTDERAVGRFPACWRHLRRSRTAQASGPPLPASLCSRLRQHACRPGRRASRRWATRPPTCRLEVLAGLGGKPHPLHRIADETTRVRELLDSVDSENAVVTADAAYARRETAEYIAESKGNQPSLQKAIFDAIQ